MNAERRPGGTWTLELSGDEAVVLHEALGRSEWGEDMELLTLENPAEPIVFTRLMLALRSAVPGLGSDEYSGAVIRAQESILREA